MRAPCKHAGDIVGSEPFRKLIDGVPGLTFGYLGNVTDRYDDRLFCIWTSNRIASGMYAGNRTRLWYASRLTRAELSRATRAVLAYCDGYDAGRRAAAAE